MESPQDFALLMDLLLLLPNEEEQGSILFSQFQVL
jgi:hypothetical protein